MVNWTRSLCIIFSMKKNGKCHSIEPFVGLKWLRFFLFHLMASFVVLFSKFDFFFIGQYSVRVVHRLDKFLLNREQSQLRIQESIRRFLLTKNHKFSDGNYYGWIFTSAASAIFHKPKTTHTLQQQRENSENYRLAFGRAREKCAINYVLRCSSNHFLCDICSAA